MLCKLCFPDLEAERLGSTASIRGRKEGARERLCARRNPNTSGGLRVEPWCKLFGAFGARKWSALDLHAKENCSIFECNIDVRVRRRMCRKEETRGCRGACSPQLARCWSLPAHLPLCCGCFSAVTSSSAPRPAVGVPNGLSCPLPSLCQTVLSRYKDFPVP